MVNTNPSGVPNNLDDIKVQITEILDEIYAVEKKTSPWRPNPALVRGFQKAKYGQLATITTAPLADYDKALGYVAGAVGLEWKPYELRYDRGRSFVLDAVDMMQEEGVLEATAVMAGNAREYIVPEQDKLAMAAAFAQIPTDNKVSEALTAGNVIQNIGDLLDKLRGITGIEEGYSVFISSKTRSILRNSTEVTKTKSVDGYSGKLDLTANTFDGQTIIYVPAERMMTAYDVIPGGGVNPGASAKQMQVVITAPNTVQNIVAHSINDIFGPGLPDGKSELVDGVRINTRIFYDTIVPANKAPGTGAIVTP